MPIKVVKSEQACALGAAIFGAVASNIYENTFDAMEVMGSSFETVYEPNQNNVPAYQKVYQNYSELAISIEKHIMKTV